LRAIGSTRFLIVDCDQHRHCSWVLIDRSSGNRHRVGTGPKGGAPYGAISPDGRTAALFAVGRTGHITLYLLDLASGTKHPIDLDIDQAVTDGSVTWSPDSRWLFAISANGQVKAIAADSGRVTMLDSALPKLSQLAIRSASTN
jgi:Tol biopolymer transport system component